MLKYTLLLFSIINGLLLLLIVKLFTFHIYLKIKGLTTFEYLKKIRYIPVSKKNSKKVFAVRNKDKVIAKIEAEISKKSSFSSPVKKRLGIIDEDGGDTPVFNKERSQCFDDNPKETLENFLSKQRDVVVERNNTYQNFSNLKLRVIEGKSRKQFSRKKSKIPERSVHSCAKSRSNPDNPTPVVVRSVQKRLSSSLCTLNNDEYANKTTEKGSSLTVKSLNRGKQQPPATKNFMVGGKELDFQMKVKEKIKFKLKLPVLPSVLYTRQTVTDRAEG